MSTNVKCYQYGDSLYFFPTSQLASGEGSYTDDQVSMVSSDTSYEEIGRALLDAFDRSRVGAHEMSNVPHEDDLARLVGFKSWLLFMKKSRFCLVRVYPEESKYEFACGVRERKSYRLTNGEYLPLDASPADLGEMLLEVFSKVQLS